MMKNVFLSEIGTIITGNTPRKDNDAFYDSKDIPFVKPDDFQNKNQITSISDANNFVSERARNKARIVHKNSILVTCIGIIGKIALVRNKEVAFNQQINAIVPNESVLPEYLVYALLFNQNRLQSIANAPVVPIINKNQFSSFEISIHKDIKKQQKIASTLDLASELIEKRKEQIAEMDKLIQSVFYEMFEKHIRAKKFISLGSITNHISSGATPKGGSLVYKKEGIRFIRSQNVLMNCIDYTDVVYISEETHHKMNRSKLKKNDILLNITGASIGRVATYSGNDDEANTNQHVAAIRLGTNDFSPFFISYFLASDYQQAIIKNISSGGTREALNYQQIKNFQIPNVDIVLQNQFTSIVKEIELQKRVMEESLHEMENNLNALMQKAFRGELFPEE